MCTPSFSSLPWPISARQYSHPLPAAGKSINDQPAKDDFIGSAADLFKIRLLSHLETFSTTGLMRNNNLKRLTRFNQFVGDET